MSSNSRIKSIDGWRAIACLGVLYGHVLGQLKTPSFHVAGVDVLKIFNLWGSGVHLFFVISGFCFYLVMVKQGEITWSKSLSFWKNRWWRIAPAYYTAILVYAAYSTSSFQVDLVWKILCNMAFIHPYVMGAEIAALFWSLSVEWIFYLILPFIFSGIHRLGLIRTIAFILVSGLLFNILHYSDLFLGDVVGWYYLFPGNYEHFGWGILIGYLYQSGSLNFSLLSRWSGAVIGLIVAYLGKIMFFSGTVRAFGNWGWLVESFGPLVMTFGFSIMILTSLRHDGFSRMMGNRFFTFIGRISYSFYLWHVLLLGELYARCYTWFPQNGLGVVLLFVASSIVIVPISWLSYELLESFYFKRRQNVTVKSRNSNNSLA